MEGCDVTVTWTGSDVTGRRVDPEVRHFFLRYLVFREFSGMFVHVRDVFGLMVRGRSPYLESRYLRMRAFFSHAFLFFGVFHHMIWVFKLVLDLIEMFEMSLV